MNRLLRVYVPVGVGGLVVSEAIVLGFAYTIASLFFLYQSPAVVLLDTGGWKAVAVVPVAVLISMHLQDLYSELRVDSWVVLVQQLCTGFGVALVGESVITYVHPALRVPVHVMLAGSLLAMPLLALWRLLYTKVVLSVVDKQRVLFVGTNALVVEIANLITEHQELGLAVAGYIGEGTERESVLPGKNLGPLDRLVEIVRATRPGRIVVGLAERRGKMPVEGLLNLRFSGYLIEEATTAFELLCGRVAINGLRPTQLILSSEFAPRMESVRYQSMFNYAFALVGLVLFSPLMLLAAVAVKVSSPGPIFCRQARVGRAGRVFTHYSFRLQPKGRAATLEERTPVGRVLSRLGLAEIPCFWNVLRGEMSIVGPRAESPERAAAAREEVSYYRHRQAVKPGMTGWAQTHEADQGQPLDPLRMLEYDLYYIKHISLSLDAYILFRTVKRVLQGRLS